MTSLALRARLARLRGKKVTQLKYVCKRYFWGKSSPYIDSFSKEVDKVRDACSSYSGGKVFAPSVVLRKVSKETRLKNVSTSRYLQTCVAFKTVHNTFSQSVYHVCANYDYPFELLWYRCSQHCRRPDKFSHLRSVKNRGDHVHRAMNLAKMFEESLRSP